MPHSQSLLVRFEMSETEDFLDSLLAEWFGASDHFSLQTPGFPTAPSCEDSFVDSVLDFNLSLLQPSSSSSPTSSGDPALFVPNATVFRCGSPKSKID